LLGALGAIEDIIEGSWEDVHIDFLFESAEIIYIYY